ncbi:PREDICTED: shugoshin-1-like [Erythranthe guttata]|uniref:shugoshin-1-like n=1 Tax=Erythranthe guttata TaxID=4155 RepID=UPI00064DB413|nr:PREDICTED: shugoshin-1-like [Erythranthe guttata]|eukprot:XP_012843337.1 PREDICTED: shugoshin-1-like [Erythranthe guttata]
MSKTKDFLILNSQNDSKIGDKIAMRCPQNVAVARPKLADISNLPQKPQLLIQHEKSQSIPVTTKEYIEQLQKENMALAKMVAQRNKIIEQSGIELDRLRVNMIKMQEQNRQLALSHTLTLTELNSGKDRLKALQHELGCKIGLLKARELQNQEEKASTRPRQNENVEVNILLFTLFILLFYILTWKYVYVYM